MKRLSLLILPLLLAGCPSPKPEAGAPPPPPPPPPAPAEAPVPPPVPPTPPDVATELGRFHWVLQDAKGADGSRIDALFARPDKPLGLDFADDRLSVANACNRMGGRYTLADGKLALGAMASTRMACADPKLAALDAEVGKRLAGSLDVALATNDAGSRLTLTNAAGDAMDFAGEPTAASRHGGTPERVFLEVAADTRPCSHPLIPDKQCLQVRELRYDDKGLKVGTPGEFRNFYDGIEGYTHEPGVRNVLRINRYTRTNPPADASKYAYVLDMVVESDGSAKQAADKAK